MKTGVYLIITMFISITCITCSDKNDDDDPNPPYNNSYIQKFTDIELITVSPSYGVSINEKEKTVYFETDNAETKNGFYLKVEAKSSNGYLAADAPKTSESYKIYSEYINLINDKDFRLNDRYYGVLSNPAVAITDTLISVTVTCNKPFNSETPANSSLNHIISVFFDNPYNVIKNNYKNYVGVDSYYAKTKNGDKVDNLMINSFPYAFVGGELSNMDWKSKPFIGNKWLLVFTQKSTITEECIFTVKMTNKRGETFEISTQPIEIRY